jgi:uncharacterized integral membrane protein
MGRVIVSVVLLVLLTVLIVMNLGPTTSINLFGARFEKMPVVALAMMSFVLGVVYSLFLYVGHYFHRSSREKLAQRHKDIEERERRLEVQEQAEQTSQAPPAEAEFPAQDEPQPPESALARFLGLFR